jgi:hypothetical protein
VVVELKLTTEVGIWDLWEKSLEVVENSKSGKSS